MNSPCRKMTDDFLRKIENYRKRIDSEIIALLKKSEPQYLYDPIQYVFEGRGKRLRPILVLLSADMYSVETVDAMPAALSVELLHNFSLVHDDIMDQDDLRHGKPTVYRKWDESAAILAGDAIFAMACSQLTCLEDCAVDAVRMFTDTTLKLCEGQALDKAFEARSDVNINDYLEMVSMKTGTLLSLCCQLGGLVGGASKDDLEALSKFGKLLGQSFQIQDDVLEIFSDTETMGKSLGSDVATGKVTYLSCAASDYDFAGWEDLTSSFKRKDMKSEIIPALRNFFEECGLKTKAEQMVEELLKLARVELESIQTVDKSNLAKFAELILQRRK